MRRSHTTPSPGSPERSVCAPGVHAELALGHGVHVSRKRVARLMREAEPRRRLALPRRRRGTPRGNPAPAAPDRVRRVFTATQPDELWVADITYVPTWEGWLFLAVVIDAFSRRCVLVDA